MPVIERLRGREILDSRGRPTVLATCELASGAEASASVPSGASTGAAEARELRDNDPRRYQGRGCLQAVGNVNGILARHLIGRNLCDQMEVDRLMTELDGTNNKSRIGANAILAVSVAFARACALERGVPLWHHFAEMAGTEVRAMPRLTINLFSGGKHAGEQVPIQDVLLVPVSTNNIDTSLVMASDIYHAAADLVLRRYGMRPLTADEGGLAPPFGQAEEMLATAVDAITAAGYRPGIDCCLAIDVAASHFYKDGHYHIDGAELNSDAMIALLVRWIEHYPIISVEDGLAEGDWDGWPHLRRKLAGRAFTLGDDLLCTRMELIERARQLRACDALLLKVNQVGTLSEASEARRKAREAGWAVILSVRSGETEDTWEADLAVGWQANHFKNGSIRQSERLAKYNRLLYIEQSLGKALTMLPYIGVGSR